MPSVRQRSGYCMMTPCDGCQIGYCERHKMQKTEHLVMLCQTREDYRKLWDKLAGRPVPAPTQVTQATVREDIQDQVTRRREICGGCEHFRIGQVKIECWCEIHDLRPRMRNCDGAKHRRFVERLRDPQGECKKGKWPE